MGKGGREIIFETGFERTRGRGLQRESEGCEKLRQGIEAGSGARLALCTASEKIMAR